MKILDSHSEFLKSQPLAQASEVQRKSAMEYVAKAGLPSKSLEDWHYTSTKVVAEKELSFAAPEISHDNLVATQSYLNSDFTNVVFINGIYNDTLSSELPAEVHASNTLTYNEYVDSFDALNAAYATTIYEIVVRPEVSVEKPVHFVFINTAGFAGVVAPRVSLTVSKRSSLKFVESYFGFAHAANFSNSFFEVRLEESSKLTFVRVQSESSDALNMARANFTLDKGATLESLSMSLGAQWSRHTLNVTLNGESADAKVLGVYCVNGTQHVDHTTLIDHAIGMGNTEQLYKGILDDKSRAVFNGKVIIRKDAQKANSAQLNNNLLLSSTAEADSKPNLEIYADDVKASHGSTVGQLSKEELFYLQSRAIPKDKAVEMLSAGFVSEVIYKLSDESLHGWLQAILDKSFSKLKVK